MPRKDGQNPTKDKEEAIKLFDDIGKDVYDKVYAVVLEFAQKGDLRKSMKGTQQVEKEAAKLVSNMLASGMSAEKIIQTTELENGRSTLGDFINQNARKTKLGTGRFTIKAEAIETFADAISGTNPELRKDLLEKLKGIKKDINQSNNKQKQTLPTPKTTIEKVGNMVIKSTNF